MSTLTNVAQSRPIEGESELYGYFQQFAKPVAERRVGVECEFFGVERETGKAIPYSGPRGVEAILCRLAAQFHYEPLLENGRVIALQRNGAWITLEPGAQVELSASPVKDIWEVEKLLIDFRSKLGEITHYFPGIAWLSAGIHPFSSLEEIEWVPKKRYVLMSGFLGRRGALAHEMMKLTATNQVSLDFTGETEAMEQFRLVFSAGAVAAAMFANSGFSQGQPNGWLDRRVKIWQDTDPERSGVLWQFLDEGKSFSDYVNYLLEMPLMFIVREGNWISMEGFTFRRFLREGKNGERATWADFELHLSTAFPEARFKQYLEIRGMDAQRFPLIPTIAAFWKGLLYDAESRQAAVRLTSSFKKEDHFRFYQAFPTLGLKARLGAASGWEIARQLVRLSRQGLERQAADSPSLHSEAPFVRRIEEEILKPGAVPAEALLERWEGSFGRNPGKLLAYLEI